MIYFMQREKNTENVLLCLREAGWTLQNLIIWKKKTCAVPQDYRYGKHYQVVAFATKGKSPRVFNKLRIIRDTEISKKVKTIHNYRCQICGSTLELGNGSLYAESHHIIL